MNKRTIILLKKLAAGMLMALFLFIHAVKVFHHHQVTQTITSNIQKDATQVSSVNTCLICDFHLAKDGNVHDSYPSLSITEEPVATYTFHHTPLLTSIGSTSSGRGPPAVS